MKQLLELELYKKSAELYCRALWGRGFVVTGLAVEDIDVTPLSYLAHGIIYVPERLFVSNAVAHYYRAAVAHAALHVMSDNEIFDQTDLNYMQRTVVGLVEDLRLEVQAIKYFPGLRNLWLKFHDTEESKHVSASQLMLRLSRCVLDPKYRDDHQWVLKGKKNILERVCNNNDPAIALEVGLGLANDLGQMRLPLNSGKYEQPVAYRDDNRCLWKKILEHRHNTDSSVSQNNLGAQDSKFVEESHGVQLPLASTSHYKHGRGFEIFHDAGDDLEYQKLLSPELKLSSSYPEWDYRTQVLKQDWCRILECTSNPGSMAVIEEISVRHKYTLNRLRGLAYRLRVEKLQWKHKAEDGDDYDLMYMIDAVVAVRANKVPDTRVFIRKAQHQRNNLAISILLDLSESTNEFADGGRQTVSQIIRDSVFLLAETLSVVGDSFSVTGFSSDSRHLVNYIKFKSFEENYESIKDRLSVIAGGYSTRLGAAIRHNASELAKQPERKKLLLVITDGAPSDIDVYDQNYLVQDSWYAVQALSRQGIRPFCINLDSKANKIIEYVFGRGRSETLAHITCLPDVLAHLYMRYMHT